MHYECAHERKEWALQRAGWGLMLLACVAALTGILGDGPLSRKQEGKVGEDLYLEYERYARHQAPFTLKLFCRPKGNSEFSLSFTRAFLDKHEVKEIQPEPESAVLDGNQCAYFFRGTAGKERLVTFRLTSETFGEIENEVKLDEKVTRRMQQFIWP